MKEQIHLEKRTIYNTPFLTPLLRLFSIVFLKITGWKIEAVTKAEKGIQAAGPHTSLWDFPISAMMTLAKKREIYWLGKKELFQFPFGWLCRKLGGIPVDRKVPNGMVNKAIELFGAHDKLALLIAPEGTRAKVERLHAGLLHIAEGANVPIFLGYLDWEKRIGGVMDEFIPSHDVETDKKRLVEFFSQFKGKNPQNQ